MGRIQRQGMTADTYRTERILMRRWKDADHDPFAEMCADPEVMRYFRSTMSREECAEMIVAMEERFDDLGYGLWALEIGGRFAGYTGLNFTGPGFDTSFSPCAEVGWRLARWAWGHGYASEAAREALRVGFEQHGLTLIHSWTTRTNARSEAVMKRIGMHRREDLDFDHPRTPGWWGAPHIVYSLSAEQWREYR